MLRPIAGMQFARYDLIEVNLYSSGWVSGGWVAGLNGIETNSAKLGLTGAEFGNTI